jgi:hypothetical protein
VDRRAPCIDRHPATIAIAALLKARLPHGASPAPGDVHFAPEIHTNHAGNVVHYSAHLVCHLPQLLGAGLWPVLRELRCAARGSNLLDLPRGAHYGREVLSPLRHAGGRERNIYRRTQ